MKKLILIIAIAAWTLAGCSKPEESESTASESTAPESTESESMVPDPTLPPPAPMVDPLTSAIPPPIPQTPLQGTEGEDSTEAENAVKEAESAAKEAESAAKEAESAASSLAGDIDWQNLSWDQVPNVPYEDKAQLAAWASTQVDEWKGKLTDAAKTKGMSMLSNLGDSGWQGALKDVMDAVQGVRESNPETWEMARGALVSSWENFKSVATDYIDN